MRFAIHAFLGCLVMLGCAMEPPAGAHRANVLAGDLPVGGAFTCDLVIGPELSPAQAPVEIERDRMLMSHPDMRQKMLPLSFAPDGTLLMGGRYLFATDEAAAEYEEQVLHDYTLGGVQFLDRPYFKEADCRHWAVIGAHEFAGFRSSQVVVRTERWRVPRPNWRHLLRERWPEVRSTAEADGHTAVWLLYNRRDDYVQLVYYADRVGPTDPSTPDFASLGALASAPPLGRVFADQDSWTQDMDRTQWVFMIWLPFEMGDVGEASIFPYSPPFPGLRCGDGLCVPSAGEAHTSCAADCTPRCGDAVCQPEDGEDEYRCPSDCRVPSSLIH